MNVNGDIGQHVMGNAYTERMHIHIGGVSNAVAELSDAALVIHARRLRNCINGRQSKVSLVRVLCAATTLWCISMTSQSIGQQFSPPLSLAFTFAWMAVGYLLYRDRFGNYVREHLGTMEIELRQLWQVSAEMDARDIGDGDRHILMDALAFFTRFGRR